MESDSRTSYATVYSGIYVRKVFIVAVETAVVEVVVVVGQNGIVVVVKRKANRFKTVSGEISRACSRNVHT